MRARYDEEMSVPDESTLITRAVAGDRPSLERLLLAEYVHLERHIRACLPGELQSIVGVEDILQQTFVCAYRSIHDYQLRNSGYFHAWLRAIADHRIQDSLRSERRKKRGGDQRILRGCDDSSMRAIVELISGSVRTPSQSVAVHEATQALQVALAGLPDDQRDAIRLRFLDGLSLEETATRMRRTTNAVRGLVHRAKQALRDAMGRSSRWFST